MWYFWFILWVSTGLDKGNLAVWLFIHYICRGRPNEHFYQTNSAKKIWDKRNLKFTMSKIWTKTISNCTTPNYLWQLKHDKSATTNQIQPEWVTSQVGRASVEIRCSWTFGNFKPIGRAAVVKPPGVLSSYPWQYYK